MSSKKLLFVIGLWTSLVSFVMLNYNVYLLAGILLGVLLRISSGKSIPVVLGAVVGVLFVDLMKFVTCKF